MYNYDELRILILTNYKTLGNFCKQTKMLSLSYLSRLLHNELNFTFKQITQLCEVLDIKQKDIGRIFFTKEVSK